MKYTPVWAWFTTPRRSCRTLRRSSTISARTSATSAPERIIGSGKKLSRCSVRCCGDIRRRIARGLWGSFCYNCRVRRAVLTASTTLCTTSLCVFNSNRLHCIPQFIDRCKPLCLIRIRSLFPELFNCSFFLAIIVLLSCQNIEAQPCQCKCFMTHLVVLKSNVNQIWIIQRSLFIRQYAG